MSVIALAIGVPSALFWGIGMFAISQPDVENPVIFLTVCLIFLAIALFLIIYAVIRLSFLRLCKRFGDTLSMRNVTSIPQLAGILGRNSDQTRSELQKMISRQYIRGVYLDYRNDKIGFLDQKSEPVIPVVAVKCLCCGATNQIPMNGSGKCSYCDSAIKAQL